VPGGQADSLGVASTTAGADSATVRLSPERPRRGDVVFALVPRPGGAAAGAAGDGARCRWRGRALPCYAADSGIVAMVPISAEDSAGTYELTVEGAGGARVTRQVTVEDREFGRQPVFLRRELLARVRSAGASRDARALRGVLAGESPERRWGGPWRDPVEGSAMTAGEGYGEERFYYASTDSARVRSVDASLRSRGAFAADTGTVAASDVPAWRHAGLDIAVGRGTPVRAPAAGQVADVGDYALSGRTVVVDHGQGVMTAYFHLDAASVRRGDVVRLGQTLGRVGSTGLSTGPHLHVGVYVHGRDVDPASWYRMPAWVAGTPAAGAADEASAPTSSAPGAGADTGRTSSDRAGAGRARSGTPGGRRP
jgi:murein DD-endopeptidase MepM/ murein hydrolase activator NlpD